jgi:hypothetical protein
VFIEKVVEFLPLSKWVVYTQFRPSKTSTPPHDATIGVTFLSTSLLSASLSVSHQSLLCLLCVLHTERTSTSCLSSVALSTYVLPFNEEELCSPIQSKGTTMSCLIIDGVLLTPAETKAYLANR